MERVVAKYRSHQEAENADREYYRRLSPAERLNLLLDLIEIGRKNADASSQRLERVCRVSQLERS
jgi:hypothetical protein